ncbi:hypothetical protein RF074_05345, partial [Serratia marcescens]|uniref:hypothetical protein n=1 Tax=Serratia marcescens TaxID=615 RepID=UPI002812C6ED
EIWDKIIQLNEGNEQTRENKLLVASQKFDHIKMLPGEKIAMFDKRFTAIVNELSNLGKNFENRELALKVMRSLPRKWDIKT